MVLYGPARQRGVGGYPPGPLGPYSRVVAVNPRGTEALLDTQRLGPGGGGVGAKDLATLVRVSDGRTLFQVTSVDVAALAAEGSWQGEEIITTGGRFVGGSPHPAAALVTLTVTENRVRALPGREFLEDGRPILGQAQAEATEARFLDSDGQHVALWFHNGGAGLRYVVCNTHTADCTSSRDYEQQAAEARFVANPSRP